MRDQLSERQSRLSVAQRATLEERIRDAARGASSPGRIPRRSDPGAPIPLSSAQQRLWFLDQLAPGNCWYNVTRTMRIEGALAADALGRSFEEVVARHEALRTTIANRDGHPVQIIAPAASVAFPIVRLEHVPEGGREAAALALALEDAERPFDLSRGPLLRAMLFRLSPEHHVLQVTAHHIVTDGWSMETFFREISSLYEAFSAGATPSLEPLGIQYPDFCLWQREWLETEAARAQIDHWAERLRGAAPLDLPTDRPRPAVPSFRGGRRTRMVSSRVLEGLRALAHSERATLFMVLLAAFDAFLQRHTGQDDILVATPIAGRRRPELENLIGFFANTVVVRGDLSGKPTFRELVRRVRETALDAYAHQDVPLEKLVQALRPERSLAQNPLVDVVCALHNAPSAELRLPGARVTPLELFTRTARFDLELHAQETVNGLSCILISAADLFEEETLGRLLDRFEVLLASIVESPDRCVGELDLLPESERRKLLFDWNQTERDYRTDRCVHELFELQAEQTPALVAVEFEGDEVTYEELNRRANHLAQRLRSFDVGPEVLVGLAAERSVEMVVGLLAILKAGGAYVPLDPTYPRDRLALLLEDTGASLVLTQRHLVDALPLEGRNVLFLDASIPSEPTSNLDTKIGGNNAAYVIYTSGSTGRPKGVVNTHRGIQNRLLWMQEAYGLTPEDRVLQKTPYTFDVSVWEFFWPLLTGARLVVARPEGHRDSAYLIDLVRRRGITTLHFVPSMLHSFLQEKDLTSCRALKRVFCSGEALSPELVELFFSRIPVPLHNLYGPTEAAVDVTFFACERESRRRTVPIGRPIANTHIVVLARDGNLTPIGVPGEICIGGVGVARGYLNQPELTAERFVSDPFAREPGGRLYKTGDRGRWLEDGNLEFLGRLDDQIKVRGFRVEPGEIEEALRRHSGVREAVVVAREETPGDRRLVAYVVGSGHAPPPSSDLRSFLKRSLPEYMVPHTFVVVEKLPLTPSGKVDRKTLPSPDGTRPELADAFVAPHTAVEKLLARIWAQVLRIERIGMQDNFFELGGDSILSMQIIARARQAGLHLAPRHLFRHQTIAELAAVAETTESIHAETTGSINADQRLVSGDVPLTAIQRRFLEGSSPDPHHFNQAFLLELPQRLDSGLLEQAVGHLVLHHDALRLRLVQEGGTWRQINAGADENPIFSRVDLSSLSDAEQGPAFETAAADLQIGLNLSRGPLLRVALFDLGSKRANRLLIVIHHLAVDGVSWRVLLEDLQTAYLQLSRGEQVSLPLKTTSFKEWAERLTAYARSEPVKGELAFWLAQASTRTGRLPVDYSGRVNTYASARRICVSLSLPETQALLQEVPSAYRTQINDVLLTAVAEAFAPWTGSGVLRVNLEGHGREEVVPGVDLSRTVGWFTTIFPVLLDLEGVTQPGDALKSVKEQLRAIPNRGIGYGLLRYLSGDRDIAAQLERVPQAEVSFNYLGQFEQEPSNSPVFRLTAEPSGPAHSLDALRRHLLEIEGVVLEGRLRVDWVYSGNIHRRGTVERLAAVFIEALRSLIAHCQSLAEPGFTPSDFPLAGLKQERLDRVLQRFGKK